MDKYGEMGDSLYCYPGTNILKNKLNIHDEQILEQAELELSGLASNLIEYAEPPYDLQYLKSIHAQLFGDLYDWAGKLRQIALYTTNFTEPLSYQDSAFLKLPKFP